MGEAEESGVEERVDVMERHGTGDQQRRHDEHPGDGEPISRPETPAVASRNREQGQDDRNHGGQEESRWLAYKPMSRTSWRPTRVSAQWKPKCLLTPSSTPMARPNRHGRSGDGITPIRRQQRNAATTYATMVNRSIQSTRVPVGTDLLIYFQVGGFGSVQRTDTSHLNGPNP